MRDDFTQKTKNIIAQRAGYRCSKPDCRVQTVGPALESDKVAGIGVAAHISAASPGGPRYDPSLSPDKRKDHSNGIWLCQNHAKHIDSDETRFSVEELKRWKKLAEDRAFQEFAQNPSTLELRGTLEDKDLQTSLDLLLCRAESDLAGFYRSPGWPSHLTDLNLKLSGSEERKVFDVSGLAAGLDSFQQVAVIARPGMGKTTTLIQLTKKILERNTIAIFIPLNELAACQGTIFQSLARRDSFHDVEVRHFRDLAKNGKLVLIFDGWNELDQVFRQRVRKEIEQLTRDYPDLRTVISSRQIEFDLPTDVTIVEVQPLTREQQREIAEACLGSQSGPLMERAVRIHGLGDLLTIPLYLNVFLGTTSGDSLPTTREEILAKFIAEVEQNRDKMEILYVLQGFHREYLETLAIESTQEGRTTVPEAKARTVISEAQKLLQSKGQISNILEPSKVLDILFRTHILVRVEEETESTAFQHQQFQEWFASFHVEKLMQAMSAGEGEARKELREGVLNSFFWEEPVLFACERLSRKGKVDEKVLSKAILETLGIDPLLSAEMIWRSSDNVWEEVKANVIGFVEKWHRGNIVDGAVRFMMRTGKPEFSKYIWPLISNPDPNIHLGALLTDQEIRAGVLDDESREKIAALPEQTRTNILSEIAINGDLDAVEFVTDMAVNDKNCQVQTSVIEFLSFRGEERFVKKILEGAPDEVWISIARNWHPEDFSDPELSGRIREKAVEIFNEEEDLSRLLNIPLVEKPGSLDVGMKICSLIQRMDISEKSRDDIWAIHRAYMLAPEEVAKALVMRLEHDKLVPSGVAEILRNSPIIIEDGRLAEKALQKDGAERDISVIMGVLGPKTVAKLIAQLFELSLSIIESEDIIEKQKLVKRYQEINSWISDTKAHVFFEAVRELSSTECVEEISIMSELISMHKASFGPDSKLISAEAYEAMAKIIYQWGELLLSSPHAGRNHFSAIARAGGKLQSASTVPVLQNLLMKDLDMRKQGLKRLEEARRQRRGLVFDESNIDMKLFYMKAFAAIGDERTIEIMESLLPDTELGKDAANVLLEIWRKPRIKGGALQRIHSWPDFSDVPDAYERRRSGKTEKTHQFAEEIMKIVGEIIETEPGEDRLAHAVKLAAIAFKMPCEVEEDMIDVLLQLPVPVAAKWELLVNLVHSGRGIPSSLVLLGIDNILEEAKKKKWHIRDNNSWNLKKWLMLLPFTEKPNLVLDVLDRIEDFIKNPWNLRELLSGLACAPSPDAESVLYEMVKRDVSFFYEYHWWFAIRNKVSLTSGMSLLDLICNANFVKAQKRINNFDLAKHLVMFINAYNQFRREVYDRYISTVDGDVKSILELAISESADAEGVMLLIHDAVKRDRPFCSTLLHSALRHALARGTPKESWGAFEMCSIPAGELRKELFSMVINGNHSESGIASECLNAIDELRFEYGCIETEPRHPDIATGVPWPLVEVIPNS
ncbi:MAG: hypothetical protein GX602_06320 [Dehalococcoidales bacterium]|nr:hypothetical protein [Dehalococcoidales bacterium]